VCLMFFPQLLFLFEVHCRLSNLSNQEKNSDKHSQQQNSNVFTLLILYKYKNKGKNALSYCSIGTIT
jgi:hypothetical protein